MYPEINKQSTVASPQLDPAANYAHGLRSSGLPSNDVFIDGGRVKIDRTSLP